MSLAALVQMLTEFADEASDEYRAAWEANAPDPPTDLGPIPLAIVLAAIRDCRAQLDDLYKTVETDLLAEAGEKRFVVDGLGEVEIKKQTKRTAWDMDRLVPAVITRIVDEPATMFDPTDGDLLPPAVIAQNVGERLRDCVGMYVGKSTGLRAIGLQVDEFCHEEPDGYAVKLPKRSTP